MNLSTRDDFAELAKQNQEIKLLVDPTNIAQLLKDDIIFATIAFCCEAIGPLREKMDITPDGRAESWSWEGIDEDKILVGYLSHNKINFCFKTKDITIFDLPFNQLKIEQHGLGLLITAGAKSYVIGNYVAINEQLSPETKMHYSFGGQSTIWMRELGDLGVIDKVTWQKSRSKAKLFMVIWILLIVIVSIVILTH